MTLRARRAPPTLARTERTVHACLVLAVDAHAAAVARFEALADELIEAADTVDRTERVMREGLAAWADAVRHGARERGEERRRAELGDVPDSWPADA